METKNEPETVDCTTWATGRAMHFQQIIEPLIGRKLDKDEDKIIERLAMFPDISRALLIAMGQHPGFRPGMTE